MTVRVWPWTRGRLALLGDAAHAIVPFYGQGMNCAFEDVVELDRCLDETGDDWSAALPRYARRRKPHADAIADWRSRTSSRCATRSASPWFRLGKRVEHALERLAPDHFESLYELVSFTTVPYAEARAARRSPAPIPGQRRRPRRRAAALVTGPGRHDMDDEALLGPAGEALARELDASGDGADRRDRFAVPDGVAYLAGNSLGLQPLARAEAAIDDVLHDWATLAVAGHLEGSSPWAPYHETMSDTVARLVGARHGEAVVMNSLTVNLHLLLGSFYRPRPDRYRVVIEADVFPSDRYAVMGAVRGARLRPGRCGRDPPASRPRGVAAFLDREGDTVAVVVLSAVDFRSGALLDIPAITAATRRAGAVSLWDLAHAVGNVPLHLHDWDVDVAVWCHYKYVNAGPGAVGGCFVHERHGADPALVRPGGWWGHDPASRFDMPFDFRPQPGAAGWQVSNPPILSMAPVRVALELIDDAGMDALRARSIRLTGFLERLLDAVAARRPLRLLTPRDPERRGAQLSVEVDDAAAVTERLYERHRVRCDDRPPSIIRLAPAPALQHVPRLLARCRRARRRPRNEVVRDRRARQRSVAGDRRPRLHEALIGERVRVLVGVAQQLVHGRQWCQAVVRQVEADGRDDAEEDEPAIPLDEQSSSRRTWDEAAANA